MPAEITDEKIIKRLQMEKEYYQNTDVNDAIDTVAGELKIKKRSRAGSLLPRCIQKSQLHLNNRQFLNNNKDSILSPYASYGA